MLTKETTKKLKALGIDPAKLSEAHIAETETVFEVPDLVTEAQLTERDTNTIAAARDGIFKEGKDAGLEIAGKAIAKKYGLADVDFKDPGKIIAALDTTVAKGDTGLKEQIGLLQADKLRLETDIAKKDGDYKAAQFDTDLITHFPQNRATINNDKEYLALTKMNLEFAELDGKQVVKRNGEVLRDKTTQAPIAIKDAVTSLFNEKKWVGSEGGGGRGGDDNSGGSGGIKTYSGAEKAWLKANPDGNLMSTEFQSHIQKLAKETTDFNMDA